MSTWESCSGRKHFDWHADAAESDQATFLCPGGLTAWPVLQPAPARGRGAPGPQRGGQNLFPVRTVFVLTGDGDLHPVNVNTGEDLGPPLKFLPPNGKPYSLAFVNDVVYTITGQGVRRESEQRVRDRPERSGENRPLLAVRYGRALGHCGAGDWGRRHRVRGDRRRTLRPGVESLRELGRSAAHAEGLEAQGLVYPVECRVALEARIST